MNLPVKDTVFMYGIREIGKNIPIPGKFSYFPEEVIGWMAEMGDNYEFIKYEIKPRKSYQSHYEWLEEFLKPFFEKCGVKWEHHAGIITAHGDKAYGYKFLWEEHNIPFYHGVAIYLLSYCSPYSSEVRETKDGFVSPSLWVANNYERFKPHLDNYLNECIITHTYVCPHGIISGKICSACYQPEVIKIAMKMKK